MTTTEDRYATHWEQPTDEANDALVDDILGWLLSPHRPQTSGCTLVALFGARGSGKTSTLHRLWKKAAENKKIVVAETGPETSNPAEPAIFDLAQFERDHDVLLAFLKHLQQLNASAEELKGAQEIRLRTQYWDRLVDIETEMAPSVEDIPERLREFYLRLLDGPRKANEAIQKVIETALLKNGSFPRETEGEVERFVLLLIDDLDLHPERTLPMLEMIHLQVSHPRVVVVLASDEAQMLAATQAGLHTAMRRAGVREAEKMPLRATSVLDKLIPYRWSIPPFSRTKRFYYLWREQSDGAANRSIPPQLSRWWPKEAGETIMAGKSWMVDSSRASLEHTGTDLEKVAYTALRPVLPRYPRQLKLLHNRLSTEARRAPDEDTTFYTEQAHALGIPNRLVHPFVSVLLAIDVQFPTVRLWESFEEDPEDLRTFLDASLPPAPAEPEEPQDGDEEPESEENRRNREARRSRTLFHQTLKEAALANDELSRVDRMLQHLGMVRDAFAASGSLSDASRSVMKPGTPGLLIVSFNADAYAQSEELRLQLGANLIVEHLDLVEELQVQAVGRPSPDTIRRSARTVLERLPKLKLDRRGELSVFARWPLPFACWMGDRLWDFGPKVAYNKRVGGELTAFRGPRERLRPLPDRLPELIRLEDGRQEEGERGHAAVLIDVLGKATEHHHRNLVSKSRAAVSARLRGRRRLVVGPEHVEAIIQDILDEIERLRQRDGVHVFHLALIMPDALAFLLGGQLHALGEFILYDLWQERYEPVMVIGDDPLRLEALESP